MIPLERFNLGRFSRNLTLTVATVLVITAFLFAPRLWTIREYLAGRMDGGRAESYLLQCADPFRRDVEPAMLWRVLPPLVCNALALRGLTPLAVPVLGGVILLAYVGVLLRRQLPDGGFVLGGTLLFATTSAILVPLNWLGLNDAWVWLGLLAVAFGRARWALPAACLLCPWIDERFIIGFPLAWITRQLDRDEPIWSRSAFAGTWLLPYAALRLGLSTHDHAGNSASENFLTYQFFHFMQLAPRLSLGWWMGLRAAWLPLGFALWNLRAARRTLLTIVLILTLLISFFLASDLSRSTAIAIPLVLLGCFAFARRRPDLAPQALLLLAAANLILPAAHIVHIRFELINSLPVELIRLLR